MLSPGLASSQEQLWSLPELSAHCSLGEDPGAGASGEAPEVRAAGLNLDF